MQEEYPVIPPRWNTSPSIQRWCRGLLQVTGLTAAEVTQRVAAFSEFCRRYEFEPDAMLAECMQGAQKLERRAFYLQVARGTPANLIVQSFLVHNGINVFGDIVCMPGTSEQLAAEQGKQWIVSE